MYASSNENLWGNTAVITSDVYLCPSTNAVVANAEPAVITIV